jgi:hypothetical protein
VIDYPTAVLLQSVTVPNMFEAIKDSLPGKVLRFYEVEGLPPIKTEITEEFDSNIWKVKVEVLSPTLGWVTLLEYESLVPDEPEPDSVIDFAIMLIVDYSWANQPAKSVVKWYQ